MIIMRRLSLWLMRVCNRDKNLVGVTVNWWILRLTGKVRNAMTIYDWNIIKKTHPTARYAAMDRNGEIYSYDTEPQIAPGFSFWIKKYWSKSEGPYSSFVMLSTKLHHESLEHAPSDVLHEMGR
jgi:hypothetical protein